MVVQSQMLFVMAQVQSDHKKTSVSVMTNIIISLTQLFGKKVCVKCKATFLKIELNKQ